MTREEFENFIQNLNWKRIFRIIVYFFIAIILILILSGVKRHIKEKDIKSDSNYYSEKMESLESTQSIFDKEVRDNKLVLLGQKLIGLTVIIALFKIFVNKRKKSFSDRDDANNLKGRR